VHETVTLIAVSILTSQYTTNLLSLFQNYALIPSFENAGEDRATPAATLWCSEFVNQRNMRTPYVL